MKEIVNHESLGEITYEESFWTGKKTLYFNGAELEKLSKNKFKAEDGEEVTLKGNFMQGVTLHKGTENVRLVAAAKWYEILLAVLPVIFIIIWGNIPQSVNIFPVIGGALGGALSALIAFTGLYVMRRLNKWYFKVLVGIAFAALAILVCYLIALAILAAV